MIRYLTVIFSLGFVSNYSSHTEEQPRPELSITKLNGDMVELSTLTIFTNPRDNGLDGVENVAELYAEGLLNLADKELRTVFIENGTEKQIGTLIGTDEPGRWGIAIRSDIPQVASNFIESTDSEFGLQKDLADYLEEQNAILIWKEERYPAKSILEIFTVTRSTFLGSICVANVFTLENDFSLQLEFPGDGTNKTLIFTVRDTMASWVVAFDFFLIPEKFYFGITKFSKTQFAHLIKYLDLCEYFM